MKWLNVRAVGSAITGYQDVRGLKDRRLTAEGPRHRVVAPCLTAAGPSGGRELGELD
jgi:hypothetical protein